MRKGKPIGRMINGVVFGLSTPRRHGNSKSSSFMNEIGMPLGKPTILGPTGSQGPVGTINSPNRVKFIGTPYHKGSIFDDLIKDVATGKKV